MVLHTEIIDRAGKEVIADGYRKVFTARKDLCIELGITRLVARASIRGFSAVFLSLPFLVLSPSVFPSLSLEFQRRQTAFLSRDMRAPIAEPREETQCPFG